MKVESDLRARAVRDQLVRVRELRQIVRNAPDQLRRDAAIVTYSRTLDSLVDDLIAFDDMGLLRDYLRCPDAEMPPQAQKRGD